jgi:hypothetical protein
MVLDTRHQVRDGSDRTAKMPRRRRTRAHQRAHDIAAERTANHRARTTTPAIVIDEHLTHDDTVDNDPGPPPF